MNRKKNKIFFFAVSTAALSLFCLIWINVCSTRLGYDVEKLRKSTEMLKIKNERLYKNINSELSLAKLQKKAAALGFVYPEPHTIVVLTGKARKFQNPPSRLAGIFGSGRNPS